MRPTDPTHRHTALFTLFPAIASALILLALPATDAHAEREVWSSRGQYVRIEPQDATGIGPTPANEHPASLEASVVRAMLGKLQVNMGDGKPVPVFNATELETLGTHLPGALAQAGPREDVTFAVIGTRTVGMGDIFKERRATTGRVFVANRRLNVIFREMAGPYSTKTQMRKYPLSGAPASVDQRLHPLLPGSRGDPADGAWTLLEAPEGVDLYAGQGRPRDDWAVVDPETAIAMIEKQRRRQEVDDQLVDQTVELKDQATRIDAEQEELRKEIRALREEMGKALQQRPPVAAVPVVAPAAAPTTHGVEERLATLERLRQKKLITEQEYQDKRKEILEDL